jgi:hypothetical protein
MAHKHDPKNVLHDPIKAKMRVSSEDFIAPTKEEATTGRFMNAGDYYGTGFRNPVGKFSASNKGPIPQESVCFPSDQGIRKL